MRVVQTKRDLCALFKQRGIRANRLLGQHFLVDHNVLDFICRVAELSARDVVLEVGAGTGLLTEHLARSGARVVAVEIDRRLFEVAMEYVGDAENVVLVCGDVHGRGHRLSAEVESALGEALKGGGVLKVVSNLPYCVSTELVLSLLELPWVVERMVLTVQKEFAERLLAGPGTREWSALTVMLAARARVERVRNLAPMVFWPVPAVGSAVVRIVPEAERWEKVADGAMFRRVVAALFAQRRKTAGAALRGMVKPRLGAAEVAGLLKAAGIGERARADGLSVGEIMGLSNVLAVGARR